MFYPDKTIVKPLKGTYFFLKLWSMMLNIHFMIILKLLVSRTNYKLRFYPIGNRPLHWKLNLLAPCTYTYCFNIYVHFSHVSLTCLLSRGGKLHISVWFYWVEFFSSPFCAALVLIRIIYILSGQGCKYFESSIQNNVL